MGRGGNVRNLKHFTSENQPPTANKVAGKLRANERRRIQQTAAQMLIARLADIDVETGETNKDVICDVLNEMAKSGNVKAMTLLFKLTGELQEVRQTNVVVANEHKVYVTKEQEQQAEQHIDDVIDG